MKTRIALIGFGSWAALHARVIQDSARSAGRCELAAVAVPSEESQRRAREQTGVEVVADYRELLKRPDIHAVSIVAPNDMHEPIALNALAAGKHVLLEKPMAVTAEGCDRIVAAQRRAGTVVLVGHELRFSPLYARVHRLVRDGEIGEPRYMLVDLWRRPYRPGSSGWKQDPARVGSWSLEEPVHYFDVMAWYFDQVGEPCSVTAFGNRRDPDKPCLTGIHDNFSAIVRFPRGAYSIISQCIGAVEHHLSVKVFGSRAVLRSEWHAEQDRSIQPSFSLSVSKDGAMRPLEIESTPGDLFELAAEIDAFVDAIHFGRPLPFTLEAARRAVLMCLAAERSLETGAAVAI